MGTVRGSARVVQVVRLWPGAPLIALVVAISTFSGAPDQAQARSLNPGPVVAAATTVGPDDPAADIHVGTASSFNVYAGTISGDISPVLAGIPSRVYVPNSEAGTVDVIDPATFKVVAHWVVGGIPHHIAPAWDLSRLYIDIEWLNILTVIDPRTQKTGESIPVMDPYNLYFTPDGSHAIVVAENFSRLDFRDPRTFGLIKSVHIPWPGVDHLDFSADGHYLMASTEWSGMVAKVDTVAMELVGGVRVGGLPIDVRLAPDGTVFYVTNQGRHGVSIVDPAGMREVGFIPTGRGAHGLQVSRDTKSLYVSNRLNGTISVIDFATQRVTATWNVGGSPDMMQLSPDGRELWVSGRFDASVYVVDTLTGQVLHRIRVGKSAHGLTYFPNAGQISLGHNGVYR